MTATPPFPDSPQPPEAPLPPGPLSAAEPTASNPPLAPSTAPNPPSGPASPPASGSAWKSWVAAGVVAAIVAGGVAYGVSQSASHSSRSAGAVTANGANGNAPDGSASEGGSGAGQGGRFAGRGVFGKLTAVDGSTLTVHGTSRDGTETTYKVKVSADTVVTETTDGSLADLKQGDAVLITTEQPTSDSGTATSDVSPLARRIVDRGTVDGDTPTDGTGPDGAPPSPPEGSEPSASDSGTPPGAGVGGPSAPGDPSQFPGGRQGRQLLRGTVKAVDGTTLTISTSDGTEAEVRTDSTTTVSITQRLTLGDLKVGDTVSAQGAVDGTTITARSIRRGDAGMGDAFGGFGGPPDQGGQGFSGGQGGYGGRGGASQSGGA